VEKGRVRGYARPAQKAGAENNKWRVTVYIFNREAFLLKVCEADRMNIHRGAATIAIHYAAVSPAKQTKGTRV
jgi:hypothetical protein